MIEWRVPPANDNAGTGKSTRWSRSPRIPPLRQDQGSEVPQRPGSQRTDLPMSAEPLDSEKDELD